MHDLAAPLVASRQVASRIWVLGFEAPQIAEQARAGQFVNILLRPGPLLRRPFSVYRATDGIVEVALAPVGLVTQRLIEAAPGTVVSMLGPLGNGYAFDPAARSVALVSGGVGVAPMPLAAREARSLGIAVHWVHGARTGDDLCTEWEGDRTHWATDDGSFGVRGSVLDAVPAGVDQVLACGPHRMLRALAARWPAAQVAVETYMGCGTGVCLSCAVPRTSGEYDRACVEGPVYIASSIRWSELPDCVSSAPDVTTPSVHSLT